MLFKQNTRNSLIASTILASAISVHVNAGVTEFSEDYENMNLSDDTSALTDLNDAGWKVGGQVFSGPDLASVNYFYGLFDAPNHNFGHSAVATGDATKDDVGTQYLNIFSDYNNADAHANPPKVIQTLVVKEWVLDASDIGSIVTLTFDAKRPEVIDDGFGGDSSPAVGNNCSSTCTASAFIKTLDPANNYNTTNLLEEDTSAISQSEWTSFSISIDLSDALLEGQILQLGFDNFASNYENSGVYYDNVSLTVDSQAVASYNTPIPGFAIAAFGALLGWAGLTTLRKQIQK